MDLITLHQSLDQKQKLHLDAVIEVDHGITIFAKMQKDMRKHALRGGRIYIGDALDCNDTNQRDNCQDSSQTVENPFARRYVDFQIVHRVVHTV